MTQAWKQHLIEERSRWEALVEAVASVLGPAVERCDELDALLATHAAR